ncbi:MAG: family transcriptional regulator, cyclic receptor protein [Solirubrobacteraceae bacterium]|nr:family transcriptional regulator, cyclic receptor protein [Solirubrobacteraceae bacterium]
MAFPHLSQPAAQGVRILDVDPDLGVNLSSDRFDQARQALVARTEGVPRGAWKPDPQTGPDTAGGIGLLLLEGVLVRRLSLGHRSCAELLGPGDLLRPSQDGFSELLEPFTVSFRAIEPLMLAILDVRFVARSARFPEMTGELISRALDRSRLLARMLAVAQLPRVDTRLLIAMWHLSERWGTVRPEGRVLPGFLSHELLGWIVGARRPSVTTALGQLSTKGLVIRQTDGSWLLTDQPPEFDGLTAITAS